MDVLEEMFGNSLLVPVTVLAERNTRAHKTNKVPALPEPTFGVEPGVEMDNKQSHKWLHM